MEDIHIESKRSSPEIIFKFSIGYFEIKGMSLPEDTEKFYNHLLSSFEQYMLDPKPITKVVIGLAYYNTTTARALRNFFEKLNRLHNNGYELDVTWGYEEDDPEMRESIERFDDFTDFKLKIVSVVL